MYIGVAIITFVVVMAIVVIDTPHRYDESAPNQVRDQGKIQPAGFVDLAGDEHALSVALDRDLAATRERLAQVEREKALAVAERQSARAAAAAIDAKLQDEQKREIVLADKLAEADRQGSAQAQRLQQRLDNEEARSAGLDHDLATARQQLTEAQNEKTVEDAERRSAGAAASANDAELQSEQKRAIVLADKLAEAERRISPESNTTAQFEAVSQEAGSKRPASERTAPKVAGALQLASPSVNPLAQAARGFGVLPPLTHSAIGNLAKIGLPQGVPARVVLHYARGNEAAQTRAIAIRSTLQALGFDVADVTSAPGSITANGVSYFYSADQRAATSVASALAASALFRSRLPVNEPLPRPGTIEVAVAG